MFSGVFVFFRYRITSFSTEITSHKSGGFPTHRFLFFNKVYVSTLEAHGVEISVAARGRPRENG